MDRLAKLKEQQEARGDVVIEMNGKPAGPAYLKQFEEVKAGIRKIRANTEEIRVLRGRAEIQFKNEDDQETMISLEKIMDETKKEATLIKKHLEVIEKDCDIKGERDDHSTEIQIRTNLLSTQMRHFRAAMKEFQDASEGFRDALRGRVKRQAKYFNEEKEVTDEQVEEIINSKNLTVFLREGMGLQDVMVDEVAKLEARAERMRAVEQGVKEIYELFKDLAMLVELQQEYLDNIQQNVSKTKDFALKGEQELLGAQKHQRSARKCKCYLLILLLVILGIICIVGVTQFA